MEGAAVPLGDSLEAEAVVGAVGGGEFREEGLDFGEEVLAGGEAGDEALADESGDENLEFEAGGVGGGAAVWFPLDGAEGFEGAEALACGAFADAEAGGDVVHGEGFGRGEEDAVDLAVGAGVAKEVGEFGEDFDEGFLKAGGGGGAVGFARGAWGGGGRHRVGSFGEVRREFNSK